MTPKEFQQLANQGYNRIPLMKTVLADLDTPLSAYLKLANGKYSYLLESVEGGEKWGRYSMIGLPAQWIVRVYGWQVQVEHCGEVVETHEVDDPLVWLAQFQQRFKVPQLTHLPRFTGGLVGYFGYDTVRYVEPRLAQAAQNNASNDPLGLPDMLFMLSDEVVVFDNLSGKVYLIVHALPEQKDAYAHAMQRLTDLEQRLHMEKLDFSALHTTRPIPAESDFVSGFSQTEYMQAVETIKDYIVAGDVMQVVLAQRMSVACTVPPLNIYRALRCLNPSPYMYFFNWGDFHIVGSSPEILVRLEDGLATVRPLAGTRPRGETEAQDKALEADLLADPKECAEHLMLIDLGRNDIGRVAEIGSVTVSDQMSVERYSHVMHIVSNVVGQLKPDVNALDLLRATFPAGTLSGAPKIRAMEIIAELEPVKRGLYGGAVGYLAWHGDMDVAIAIRTALIKDQTLYIQAGAGIVADSVPENEWQETLNKGRALFKAVAMASAGLAQE